MGSNHKGQLGIDDPDVDIKMSPVLVEALVKVCVTQVACGDYHNLALDSKLRSFLSFSG